jgi:hypothetical protein
MEFLDGAALKYCALIGLPKRPAVNRALRKAYGIRLCPVEELGWLTGSPSTARKEDQAVKPPNSNGSSNGQPKLRDRLCPIIEGRC